MDSKVLYNKDYYTEYTGYNYHNEKDWEPLFKRLAKHIVEDIRPASVLDTGCAFGYMVAYLRDLGVDAWGIDISDYAINQAREDIKPYLRVMSITEELPSDMPQKYDLILNIEVLEHLYEEDGMKAMKNLSKYSNKILFSSTPTIEPTHFNIQQIEYWAEKFATLGYFRNILYDTEYISKYSGLYEKQEVETSRLIRQYEHYARLYKLNYEGEQLTSSKLAKDVELIREQYNNDTLYYKSEVNRLMNEVNEYLEKEIIKTSECDKLKLKYGEQQERIKELSNMVEALKIDNAKLGEAIMQMTTRNSELSNQNSILTTENNELSNQNSVLTKSYNELFNEREQIREYVVALRNENTLLAEERERYYREKERLRIEKETIITSRGYRVIKVFYRLEDKLIPVGSLRRKIIKVITKKPVKLMLKLRRKLISKKLEDNNLTPNMVSFYTPSEKDRQEWCRNHPIVNDLKFSFVVPLYNTPINLLQELIESVQNQIYHNWELCLVDASTDKTKINKYIKTLIKNDSRIIYQELPQNGGISENTIASIKMATGDFIVLLDHDDIIAPNALYEYALYHHENPDTDFYYSDKDMINEAATQRMNSLFKPEYSPEIMYSANYFTHLCAIRKSVLEKTDGFDKKTDGAQDWDIFLKIMEKTNKIKRIPQILYHWRIIASSVASGVSAKPYVLDAQIEAINGYIKRKEWNGKAYFIDRVKTILKVDWEFKADKSVFVIFISNDGKKKIDLVGDYEYICISKSQSREIDSIISNSKEDVILFIDSDECAKASGNLVDELSSWALHPEIAFVAPKLHHNVIKSCGLVYDDNEVMDLFGNKPLDYYGEIGGAFWYRNLSFFRGACLAIERKKYLEFCNCNSNYGSLMISHNCLLAKEKQYRNVYDCFTDIEVTDKFVSIEDINKDFAKIKEHIEIPMEDTYFNKKVTLDVVRKHESVVKGVTPTTHLTEIDKYTSDALFLSSFYDFTEKDLAANEKVVKNNCTDSIKTMIWLLPEFDYAFYAGLYTIFRTADYLRRVYNVKHTFAFLSGLDSEIMLERVGQAFPELGKCKGYCLKNEEDIKKLGHYDASVCTLWTTAFYSLKLNNVKKKFYFIQDYEPLFYPGGSTYAQAEATYRFGFYGITNTKGLKYVYENEFNGLAEALDPSIDTNIFYPNHNRTFGDGPYTLFFYGRPGHPRNGFELGINAMKILKKRMGSKIRIVTAGANYDINAYGLNGIVENLGRLKVEETGDLYRQCDAGLVMMFTRHPSYLPYEMMACGCAVVSNYNAYTSWFLKNDENCVVTEASAGSIADAIQTILVDKDRRKKISEAAAKQILDENPDWDTSLEKVAEFIGCVK